MPGSNDHAEASERATADVSGETGELGGEAARATEDALAPLAVAPQPGATWGKSTPPMRLTRGGRARRRSPSRALGTASPAMADLLDPPPAYLRPVRAFLGLVLLAVAWGATLVVVMLALSLAQGIPSHQHVAAQVQAYALACVGLLALLFLAATALACIVAAAFCLSLALTRRGW